MVTLVTINFPIIDTVHKHFLTSFSTPNPPHPDWETLERSPGWKRRQFAPPTGADQTRPGWKVFPGFHFPGWWGWWYQLIYIMFEKCFSPQLQLEGECWLWGHSRQQPQTAGKIFNLKVSWKTEPQRMLYTCRNFRILNSYVLASILASGELTWAMMPSAIAVEPLFLIVNVQLPLSKSDALSTSKPICSVPFPLYLDRNFFWDELNVCKFDGGDKLTAFFSSLFCILSLAIYMQSN